MPCLALGAALRAVREALEAMEGRVEMAFRSPGCPDLNAIEEV